jgi:hypothetical protein
MGPSPKALEKLSAKLDRLIPAIAARLSTLCGAAGRSITAVTTRARRPSFSAEKIGESRPLASGAF